MGDGGSALVALGKVSFAVCGLVFGLIYRRYLGILGADQRRPAERQAYDALRESLAKGNMASRLYAEPLAWFLDWVDRCLLLALIYPIATIIVIWGISGHVGPAEAALELAPNMPGWRRGLAGILFVVETAGAFSALRTTGWTKFAWILFAFAGFVDAADVAHGSGLLAISVAVAVAAAIAGAIVVAGAGAAL